METIVGANTLITKVDMFFYLQITVSDFDLCRLELRIIGTEYISAKSIKWKGDQVHCVSVYLLTNNAGKLKIMTWIYVDCEHRSRAHVDLTIEYVFAHMETSQLV
jgi:hypothetical protein